MTTTPTVGTATAAETLHDFYGFPEQLYQLSYAAPGSLTLAEQVAKHLHEAGLAVHPDAGRGLDHGAWEPLMLMYPAAKIPVTQLSLQPALGAAYHLRLGQALAPLRENVLIIGSGSATHNLGAFSRDRFSTGFDAPPTGWAQAFDNWLQATLLSGDLDALLDYRQHAPFALKSHPSEEHLLPLFVALGAAGKGARSHQLHASFTYGVLSMASYCFD
ncbi:MAG: dioxygenase [Leptolyngbyaceae cyanobacterium SL_1_1]|nr:dioxygenase [Leptolyngbyaceae cyanobacterium RM2_2_21]NJN02974.1 dioxygenase [Leptolyngbyaceae cyanobacterium RM1_1_2]NJO10752.1 dioxygenase [Leptolyngbyaceae cyanobacterium SL_1_1]